ncbi:hypothetical protein [Adhaeribacter aquaticus]|uniref:hypothetical protein n=1 Tax=Adhaeribacter aquaticus TaxID=299567 RepID=UPI000479F64A|nr:hypothetical protein [Adhaeribacter aquaticus]
MLKEASTKLTGESLVPGKKLFFEKYSHEGMSSGYISTDFWIDEAVPLLKKRLDDLTENDN